MVQKRRECSGTIKHICKYDAGCQKSNSHPNNELTLVTLRDILHKQYHWIEVNFSFSRGRRKAKNLSKEKLFANKILFCKENFLIQDSGTFATNKRKSVLETFYFLRRLISQLRDDSKEKRKVFGLAS